MNIIKKKVSIIIPCYNEEENIFYSYDALNNFIDSNQFLSDYDFELIYVDDGSSDNSVNLIKQLVKINPKVKLLEFSRNFGKEIALSAGLNNCTGDCAIAFDADLQYPLEKLPEFIALWNQGYDSVIGIRDKKKTNNIIEIIGSKFYYILMNFISNTDVVSGALDFRLIDRQIIDEFNKFTERERIYRVLIDWLGFKKVYLPYKENERDFGTVSYSFSKRVKLAINSIINHSSVPMNLIGLVGGIGMVLTLPITFLIFISKLTNDPFKLNITSTVSLSIFNSLLTSLILLAMWLLSKYIGNIHNEVTNRPLYVLKK
jgi:polyisoprenyl-phosphate glycosyltransferase